jgi:hypothetical protein
MLSFRIDELLGELRKAVVNPELGVEKEFDFHIHESLADQYLKSVLEATEKALKDRLGLTKPEPVTPTEN